MAFKTAGEGECSDTTYNTHVALKLRHHLQHTHVALKLQVRGSAVTPLTTYTCGAKTAGEGECSDTTYNTHVVLKLRHHLQHTHVALKLQVKGSAVTPLTTYTCGAKTAGEGECSDTTYNTHVVLKLRHHLQHTHVALKRQVKGSAVKPLTIYTCGVKTASGGDIHMWR